MKLRVEQEIELLRMLIPEAARVLREPERKTWLPDFLARGPRALLTHDRIGSPPPVRERPRRPSPQAARGRVMRAVTYARRSMEHQDGSVERQVQLAAEFIRSKG